MRPSLSLAIAVTFVWLGMVLANPVPGGTIELPGENRWNRSPGDLMFVPDSRHALEAVEESAVLLTVAKRPCSPRPEAGDRVCKRERQNRPGNWAMMPLLSMSAMLSMWCSAWP
jgi:hypothetical protein